MNRRIVTVLATLVAATFAVPAAVMAADDTSTTGTHAQSPRGEAMREKWKAMTPAERKQWKADHPEAVKKMKEHRAKSKAMKEGSASAADKESIAK